MWVVHFKLYSWRAPDDATFSKTAAVQSNNRGSIEDCQIYCLHLLNYSGSLGGNFTMFQLFVKF